MKNNYILLFLFGILLIPATLLAQTEPEDIASVNNDFENFYYESLKQKGIENYDKAINALEKCQNLQPKNAIVYFEMGKNYLFQKKYKEAYENFEKATKIDPTNKWFWVGMYEVCYETRDFNQAIIIVEKLVEFNGDYKEDLTSLYMNTQQYDKALALINELNDKVGNTEKRDNYKMIILQQSQYQGSEKDNLIAQIKKNPKEEANYINLIYLYSKNNEEEKANEIAKQLEKEIPNSDWAQVSLFKFNLNNNEGEKAVKSMNIVLQSEKIDKKIKQRIFNEFLIFTQKNPQFNPDLEKAIRYFDNDKEVKVASEIGKFFYTKKDFPNAIKYFEIYLQNDPNDMETILLLLQAYTDYTSFDKLAKVAEEKTELFPSQPELYYYAGLANNQLQKFKKAKDFLETGLDFVVENATLEINFNIQLGESFSGLGDVKKKESYFTKANDLIKKQKK